MSTSTTLRRAGVIGAGTLALILSGGSMALASAPTSPLTVPTSPVTVPT